MNYSPLTRDWGKAPTEDIKLFEKLIGVRLPSEFKSFLIEQNGGYFSKGYLNFRLPKESPLWAEDDDCVDVHRICGLHPECKEDNLITAFITFRGRVPGDKIPFASDPLGNQFLIGIQGEDAGKVFFWDHEQEGLTSENINFPVTKLEESFFGFINNLKPEEIW